MKLTTQFFSVFATVLFLSAPAVSRADNNITDAILDSTHDLRAQIDLLQESLPMGEASISDSWSMVSGGSPFSQGTISNATVDDLSPGLDVGTTSNYRLTSLEDLSVD